MRSRRGNPRSAVPGLLALFTAVLVTACSPIGTASTGPASGPLTVFAAASLHDVVAALAQPFMQVSGLRIESSTDASSTLRVQIEQGAQVDAFLSADTRNPDALATEGLIDGSVVTFARNSLVIIVPRTNPAGIRTPWDLARPGVKVIAAGDSVPISSYATRLVDALAQLPAAPPAFAAAVDANVVSREDNVTAVVTKIALGEGDAAIVYGSDAVTSASVTVIPLPSGIQVVATYAGAVPTTARNRAGGRRFLDWLTSPAGQALLAPFGFSPLS